MADKTSCVNQKAKSWLNLRRLGTFFLKSSLVRLVSLFIALLVFLYIGIRAYQGTRKVLAQGIEFSVQSLILSLVCQTVGVLLAVALWRLMLGWVGQEVDFKFHLQAFCISAIAKKIPGTVWYAIGRVFMYDRLIGGGKSQVVAALALEIASMSSAGFIVLGLGVASGQFILTSLYSFEIIAIFLVVVGIILMLLSPIFVRLIHRIVQRKWSVSERIDKNQPVPPLRSILWVLGEICVVFLGSGASFFAIRAMSIMDHVSYFSVLVAWGGAVALGPLAMWLPSDIGLKDGVMYVILSSQMGGDEAALAVLFWRIWGSILEIVFGLIGILTLGESRAQLLSKKRNH